MMNNQNLQNLDEVIEGAEVTIRQVICALCDVLDGVQKHDIRPQTGLPEECCEEISRIRDAVRDIWLKS